MIELAKLLYFDYRQSSETFDHLEDALKIESKNTQALFRICEFHMAMGNKKLVKPYFKRLKAIDPDLAEELVF